MTMLSLYYASLLRSMWVGLFMNDALCPKKISKWLASEFTTSISSDNLDRQIELIFNKGAKIHKYMIKLRLLFNRKHPSMSWKVIVDTPIWRLVGRFLPKELNQIVAQRTPPSHPNQTPKPTQNLRNLPKTFTPLASITQNPLVAQTPRKQARISLQKLCPVESRFACTGLSRIFHARFSWVRSRCRPI